MFSFPARVYLLVSLRSQPLQALSCAGTNSILESFLLRWTRARKAPSSPALAATCQFAFANPFIAVLATPLVTSPESLPNFFRSLSFRRKPTDKGSTSAKERPKQSGRAFFAKIVDRGNLFSLKPGFRVSQGAFSLRFLRLEMAIPGLASRQVQTPNLLHPVKSCLRIVKFSIVMSFFSQFETKRGQVVILSHSRPAADAYPGCLPIQAPAVPNGDWVATRWLVGLSGCLGDWGWCCR